MKKVLLAFSVFAFSAPAMAQQAQQKFVPFEVTEQDAQQMRKWLDDQPMKYSLPILQWMENMEQRKLAQLKKEADDKAAAEKHNKELEEQPK